MIEISKKFGEEEGGWSTWEVREGFGVGFWKEIRKEGSLLQRKSVFSMGENNALCDSFPSLYALAASKEGLVSEVVRLNG